LFDVPHYRCFWLNDDLCGNPYKKQNPPEYFVHFGGNMFGGVQYLFAKCHFYHFTIYVYFGAYCRPGKKTTKKEKTIKKRAILQAIDLLLKKQ
jgi:hypothetical protein